jgi:hypothetical protein
VYVKWTYEALRRRLSLYAKYVGCGCYGRTPEQEQIDECRGQAKQCARADFKALVRAMRRGKKVKS